MTIDTTGLPKEIADIINAAVARRNEAINSAALSSKKLIQDLVKGITDRLGGGVFTGNSDELNAYIEAERTAFAAALDGIISAGTLEVAAAGFGIGAAALERQLEHQKSLLAKTVQAQYLEKAKVFSKEWTSGTRYAGTGKTWKLSESIWDLSGNNLAEIQKILDAGVGTDAVKLSKALSVYVKEGRETFASEYPNMMERMGKRVSKNINYEALRLARNELSEAYWNSSAEGYKNNPAIMGVKVVLSNNRPPIHDICDQAATEDLYGLGPGIYPVENAPNRFHVQCLCVLCPVVRMLGEKT